MFDFITTTWATITGWLTGVWEYLRELLVAVPHEVAETITAHPVPFAIGLGYAAVMAAVILTTVARTKR